MAFCALLIVSCAVVPLTCAACFGGFTLDGQPTKLLRPAHAQTWAELEASCAAEYPGYTLLQLTGSLNEAARAGCDQPLLPFGVYMTAVPWDGRRFHWSSNYRTPSDSYTLRADDFSEADLSPSLRWPDNGVGVVNLTSGLWHLVENFIKFDCALCQMPTSEELVSFDSTYIPDEWQILTRTPYIIVDVILQDVSDLVPTPPSSAEIFQLSQELVTLFGANNLTAFHRSETNHQGRGELHFSVYLDSEKDYFVVMANNASYMRRNVDGRHEITSIQPLSVCPLLNETGKFKPVKNMPNSIWYELERIRLGYFGNIDTSVDADQELYSTRQCTWNNASSAFAWGERTFWSVRWRNCSWQDQQAEERAGNFRLAPIFAARAVKKLNALSSLANDCTKLDEVADIVSKVVMEGNDLPVNTLDSVFKLMAKIDMKSVADFCSADKERYHIVVANLQVANPVVGFTLPSMKPPGKEWCNVTKPIQTGPFVLDLHSTEEKELEEICIVNRQADEFLNSTSEFGITLSKDLVAEFQQLAFGMAVTKSFERDSRFSAYFVYDREVDVVLTSKTNKSIYLDDDTFYIDIKFKWVKLTEEITSHLVRSSCVTRNTLTHAWTTMACRERRAQQESHTVCRCRAKHMTLDGGMLTGAFALRTILYNIQNDGSQLTMFEGTIFENVSVDYKLISFTLAECILSSFGLLSLFATAVFNKSWREDMGHKILMHMVLALTVNLILGFTTDFAHFDTESIGCIAIGVLRHYSFLAMFLWMLVLSGLQMKRLMTLGGVKTISHLILKVALFAWGVPLLPIIVLLVWNPRIYRSDRYDRGYCYPEGTYFQVTVQAPAASILLVNLFVFVAIVRHIFECGSGEKITKHSKNEKAQQLRRVCTSVFIFFLFGFTWVLHYLSEQRLIKSEFLFEYLFLMTATTHISVLSIFFVILDDKARAFWLRAAKDRTLSVTS